MTGLQSQSHLQKKKTSTRASVETQLRKMCKKGPDGNNWKHIEQVGEEDHGKDKDNRKHRENRVEETRRNRATLRIRNKLGGGSVSRPRVRAGRRTLGRLRRGNK